MAAFIEAADFPNPQSVGKSCAAFGQGHDDVFPMNEGDFLGGKLFLRPRRRWEFMIGEDSDALAAQPGEEFGRIAATIENDRQAAQ